MKTARIKILLTIRQGKIGGGESYVMELCTYLDKEKYDPVVLCFTDGPMIQELKRRGIKTKVIHTEKPFDFFVWRKVYAFIKQEKFDIIHAHGTRALSNTFWAAKRAGLPLMYTVHGWSFHVGQNQVVFRLRKIMEQFLINQADMTIFGSKTYINEGIKWFNAKKPKLVYNSVDLRRFAQSRDLKNVRAELKIPEDKTVIGYIVRITEQKDPITMIKAMKRLTEQTKDVVLLIIGDGNLKNETQELIKKLHLEDHVIFESFRTDIPDVLNAIDIYCLPSLWEVFSIGILEAMAMKKAVVTSDADGNKEIVNDGRTGLVVKRGDDEKLAQALSLMCRDRELRTILSQNGYEFVQQFGMKRLANEMEDIYDGVALSKLTKTVNDMLDT